MRSLPLHLGLLCLAIIVSIGGTEIFSRFFDPPLHPAKNIASDPLLGWDSSPSISSSTTTNSTSAVYFLGDSFTEGTSWPRQTQELLQRRGISIDAYNLGVAGFGTLQEFLKLQRHFAERSPRIVILQFFAWNDLRDNVGTPAVFYSPHRMQRPYLVHDPEKEWILRKPSSPLLSSLLSHSSLYIHRILPRLMARDSAFLQKNGIDSILLEKRPTYLSYTEEQAWDPFYRANAQESSFVASAYAVTEEALLRMKQYLEERGSLLIVLGLDAAFTVDEDVLLAHIQDPSSFDVSLPLTRMGNICKKHGISFINALPALREESRKLGKKIYNGPEGNLSGHLEPKGNTVLAHLAAEAIRTYLQEL